MSREVCLGLIEVYGLLAAIEAADTMLKTAVVRLVGYERTGGGLVAVKIMGDVSAVKAAVDAGAAKAAAVGEVWSTHVIPRPHQETQLLIATGYTVGPAPKDDGGGDREPGPPGGCEEYAQDTGIPQEQAGEDEGEAKSESEDEAGDRDGLPGQPGQNEAGTEKAVESGAQDESTGETGSEAGALDGQVTGDDEEDWVSGVSQKSQLEVYEKEQEADGLPAKMDVCNLCGDPACPRRKGEVRVKCLRYQRK